jgi:ribosome-associated protein
VTPDEVARHLIARGAWHYSRASGPGGQHRDHTETRAVIVVGQEALAGLPAPVAVALTAALGLDRRPLRLASQERRSRDDNRAAVEERLRRRVAAALRPRTARRPTSPSAASVARRLDQKARRARTKGLRRPPGPGD